MTSASRWHFVFPSPYLTTKIQHPSTNKSVSVGIVKSRTICQWAQEASHPPVHQVIGRQASVPAVVPAEAYELVLGTLQEHIENNDLVTHSQTRKPLWKSRFPEEKFQHSTGAKKMQVQIHWRGQLINTAGLGQGRHMRQSPELSSNINTEKMTNTKAGDQRLTLSKCSLCVIH